MVNGMQRPLESRRQWISGLAITITALVCLFGFWRLSPGVTFVIATSALVALIFFFWLAGRDGARERNAPNETTGKL
jgi:hypothetical protein